VIVIVLVLMNLCLGARLCLSTLPAPKVLPLTQAKLSEWMNGESNI
jgi:hypothetical protein